MSFIRLPAAGTGFTTYSRERDGADQYGLADVIVAIAALGEELGNARPFAVGDISRPKGGPFPPHAAHRNGNEPDFRPLRKDGKNLPVRWDSPLFDREATRRFLEALYRVCAVERVLFNDPELVRAGLCRRYAGHDDHLHVRLARKQPGAVKGFQARHGLTPDGIVGPKTVGALENPGKPG